MYIAQHPTTRQIDHIFRLVKFHQVAPTIGDENALHQGSLGPKRLLHCCSTDLPEVCDFALLWGLMAAPDVHAPWACEQLLGVKLYSGDLADQLELLMKAKTTLQVNNMYHT